MNSDRTLQDQITEYRAQFEKSMASIAAYQNKAQAEVAKIRTLHKEIADQHKEIEKLVKEVADQQKKTDKQLKKAHREFNSKWGRLVESLVSGKLVELLRERGIDDVTRTQPRQNVSYPRGDGTRKYKEFDIVVANGEEVVAVEVKTTLRPDDVKKFVEAMRDFSRYFPEYEFKTVYGAVAYLRCDSKAELFAERRCLYVIRATGSSASIVNDEEFEPVSFTEASSRRPRRHLRAVPDS